MASPLQISVFVVNNNPYKFVFCKTEFSAINMAANETGSCVRAVLFYIYQQSNILDVYEYEILTRVDRKGEMGSVAEFGSETDHFLI